MNFPRSLVAVAIAAASTLPLHAAEPASKPNIVFILADDLGIGDLGCFGQTKIHTPNIDRLAAEGMRFTNFYSGSAVCAPSRCTFVTGKHTGHSAVRDNLERGRTQEGQQPMPAGTRTVAQRLHGAGYFTGIIGKWGLGMPVDQSGPNDFGFDYSYGYLCQRIAHTFYPDHLWRNQVLETLPGNPPSVLNLQGPIEPGGKTYAHDLMADDALKFVRDHKSAPFFLYLAFTTPHFSLQVPEDSLAEYSFAEEKPYVNKHYAAQPKPRAAYAAMITRMDRDIGRLMGELKAQGLDEKTLVIFTSDNGVTFLEADTIAKFFNSAAGLRGMKGDLYEGGIRTPFIARWPGKVQAGSTSNQLGAFWDMLPTFCELAGADAGETDGISIVPTLLGKAADQKQHDYLYWEYHAAGGSQAVRMGEWKAIRTKVKKNPEAPIEVYHLSDDPAEAKDVAVEHPEIVAKAKAAMSARTPSPVAQWNF